MRFWIGLLLVASAICNEQEKEPEKKPELVAINPFPASAQAIFEAGIPNIVFLIDAENALAKLDWATPLAESLREKFIFASVDSKDDDVARVLDFFGLQPGAGPMVRLFNHEKAKQFWMDGEINQETLTRFLEEALEGKIAPHMKTEEIDEDWNSKPLHVLVGSNFKEVAFDSTKDVFVMFHAPWCGHCKKLSPDWEKLAESYADYDDVIIAMLDATANDVDDGYNEIRGFPTLRLYKKGENKVVEYNNDRTLEALQKFVEEHTGVTATTRDSTKEEKDEL